MHLKMFIVRGVVLDSAEAAVSVGSSVQPVQLQFCSWTL